MWLVVAAMTGVRAINNMAEEEGEEEEEEAGEAEEEEEEEEEGGAGEDMKRMGEMEVVEGVAGGEAEEEEVVAGEEVVEVSIILVECTRDIVMAAQGNVYVMVCCYYSSVEGHIQLLMYNVHANIFSRITSLFAF